MAYHRPYRGARYQFRHKLMIVLLVLLLVLLIGIGAFFFLQEYIVFTADGFRFTFPGQQTQEPPSTDDGAPPEIQIDSPVKPDEGDVPPDETPPPAEEKEPDQPVAVPELEALAVSPERLLDPVYVETLRQTLAERGMTAIALRVKEEDGTLRIPTTSEYAAKAQAVWSRAEELKAVLAGFKETDIRLIALVSAGRDNKVPRAYRDQAASTANTIWLDYDYYSWFNPYQPLMADYLSDVLAACSESGFDEVVLDKFCFANKGRLDLLYYGKDKPTRYAALEAVAEVLQQKASELNLTLSVVVTDGAAADGTDQTAGQQPQTLSAYFDRMLLRADSYNVPAFATLKEMLIASETGCRIGLWMSGDQLPESGSHAGFDLLLTAK